MLILLIAENVLHGHLTELCQLQRQRDGRGIIAPLDLADGLPGYPGQPAHFLLINVQCGPPFLQSVGNKLFVLDSNSNLTEGNLKAETYYDFYVYEISNYSIALLSSSDLFQTTSRVIVLTSVIEMFICFGIGYFISFNLIPMFLKRGRKTFGMYLFNLSVLTDEGLVVSGKKFVARQLLIFFIGYILDIFTVFIPFLVSMAMMHLSKRGQDFFDYVSGTYIIDSKNREVYMSIEEYNQANKVKQMARIENKDYQPKSELH